jgi:hypothetical protein
MAHNTLSKISGNVPKLSRRASVSITQQSGTPNLLSGRKGFLVAIIAPRPGVRASAGLTTYIHV